MGVEETDELRGSKVSRGDEGLEMMPAVVVAVGIIRSVVMAVEGDGDPVVVLTVES